MAVESQNGINLHSSISENFLDGNDSGTEWLEAKDTIKLPFADITTQEWCFDGIRVAHSEWMFHQMEKVEYNGNVKNEVVTLFFNLKGVVKTSHQGPNNIEAFELGNYQHNLFYSTSSSGSFESKENQLSTFMIQFKLPTFLRLTKDSNEVLNRFSENILEGKPLALADQNLILSGDMYQCINSLLNCKYEKGLRRMYYLSKCIELLVLQAEAYNTLKTSPDLIIKKSYDVECIYYAKEYLLEHIGDPPSLTQLSRICGLNEYKLKKGFKEIFGNTVFGFLSDKKLEKARIDLLNKDKFVSEIAYELGYSSPQHFSQAFKKKFGVSPSLVAK